MVQFLGSMGKAHLRAVDSSGAAALSHAKTNSHRFIVQYLCSVAIPSAQIRLWFPSLATKGLGILFQKGSQHAQFGETPPHLILE